LSIGRSRTALLGAIAVKLYLDSIFRTGSDDRVCGEIREFRGFHSKEADERRSLLAQPRY
jgi:hypothetical protein